MLPQTIFGDRNYKQKLSHFTLDTIPDIATKKRSIEKYIQALDSGKIEKTKEESIQADFLNAFFGDILEYNYKNPHLWNLEKEYKSVTDGSKADGALGFFSIVEKSKNADVRVVVELKDALTDLDKAQNRLGDKRTPVEQAFSYSSKAGGHCKWVIVSNFKEIRLYHASDQSRYESFKVADLRTDEELKRFFFLLQKDRLIAPKGDSIIDTLYRERLEFEQTISKQFYSQYKAMRIELFHHLKQNNPTIAPLLLINKTQKLLDRFIFVCFCEDANLLPVYTLKKIKDILKNAFDFEPNKLWRQLKGLFHSIDIGNPPLAINKFNGGLFTKDDELDALIIQDSILLKMIDFSDYDFASDLNVNILGHIFEQSLSDIEEIKAQIGNGTPLSTDAKVDIRKNGKRKKEGIFYTPEYITRYIVKEAIGGWLDDRKRELGFYDLPELTDKDWNSIALVRRKDKKDGKFYELLEYNENIKRHRNFWESYKEVVRNIKVLDPACGSGAFLNQAFDYLNLEGCRVNDNMSRLNNGQREIFELDRHILTKNIYGVDLNPESVEITKLSLWLKTAKKDKELTALDSNIRCGNSLIDDPAIAGPHAFDWNANFPEVFPSGFDVIIGNPPYGTSFTPTEKSYLKKWDETVPDYETYIYFISRGKEMLGARGVLSYIFPNTFLSTIYGEPYRQMILENYFIIGMTDLSNDSTFNDASVRTCIFTFKKEPPNNNMIRLNTIDTFSKSIIPSLELGTDQLNQNLKNWLQLFYFKPEYENIVKTLRNHQRLSDYCEISQGLIPYDKYRGHDEHTIKNRIWHSNYQVNETYKKELKGGDITRYYIHWNGELWISYGNWLAAPREQKFFTQPRLLIREIVGDFLFCSYTEEEYYNTPSIINVIQKNQEISLKFLLALLNSKLLAWFHHQTSPKAKKGLFPKILINDVRNLPIPSVEKDQQKAFIEKADHMLVLLKQFHEFCFSFIQFLQGKWSNLPITNKISDWYHLSFEDFRLELEKQKIKLSLPEQAEWLSYFNEQKKQADTIHSQIKKTDEEINIMVYHLYGLTEEEIKVIENPKQKEINTLSEPF